MLVRGQEPSKQDPLVGMAQGLVTAGVPAVIAMQFAISDALAIAFARSLYQALADNVPLEHALSEARKTMFASQAPNSLAEWGTPVLFMRAEEGSLLELAYSEALSGLASLTELAKTSPEVQRAVVSYRNGFTTARKDIEVLGNYKDLHDQLHQLQYSCYNLIVNKLRTVTTSAAVADGLRSDDVLLETSKVTLLHLTDNMRRIIGQGSFTNYDTSWLSHLEQAHEALSQTLLTWDLNNLKRVRRDLDRVLNKEPSKINSELEFTAKHLKLPQVVTDMISLRDHLASLKLEPKTVTHFASGVEALVRLDKRLTALLQQHAAWQTIDTDLRLLLLNGGIETRLETDPDLVQDDWRELIREKVEQLSRGVSDDLSGQLNEYAAKIEEALKERNAALLERHLELYRRCVGLRFFRVDADLKTACDELRKVGDPLDALLGILEVVS